MVTGFSTKSFTVELHGGLFCQPFFIVVTMTIFSPINDHTGPYVDDHYSLFLSNYIEKASRYLTGAGLGFSRRGRIFKRISKILSIFFRSPKLIF